MRQAWRGLTLIEVLFATTLIGLIIIFLFCLYPSSVMAVRRAEHRMKAVQLAQSILEVKRFGPFSELGTPPGMYNEPVKGDDGTMFTPSRYECYEISGSDPAYLKGIRVTVSWKDKDVENYITQEIYVYRIQQ